MTSSPFPDFPVSGITIPSTPLINEAVTYLKKHTDEFTVNHCIRSTAFAMILLKKFPPLVQMKDEVDVEALVLSILLHDMGWATTKELISKDKRFEVDGANVAREFIKSSGNEGHWDKHRIQLLWDAIALHTSFSIAVHKEPEVMACHTAIGCDFFGPNIPLPTASGDPIITPDEFREILQLYPRMGFKENVRKLFCNLCKEKDIRAVADNIVGEYGKVYGVDGKGAEREEFVQKCEEQNVVHMLEGSLDALVQYEK